MPIRKYRSVTDMPGVRPLPGVGEGTSAQSALTAAAAELDQPKRALTDGYQAIWPGSAHGLPGDGKRLSGGSASPRILSKSTATMT
jgi:hypothetical protein